MFVIIHIPVVIIYIAGLAVAFFAYIHSRDISSEIWELYSPIEEELVYIVEEEYDNILDWVTEHV